MFNGDPFIISGGACYRSTTNLGSVPYSTAPRFAAAQTYLAVVVGGALYIYDGTTFKLQSTFDDGVSPLPPFSGVAVLYNIWIYPVAGSNQFYFSRAGSPAIINAANFGAAQTNPTPIVEVAVCAEELYFFKTVGTEIWDFTGQLTAPFAESPGRTFTRGLASQNSVTLTDNSLFWIADDYEVYRSSIVPEKVGSALIDDRIRAEAAIGDVTQIPGYTFNLEGHVYYVISLPVLSETYAYDVVTRQWFRWGTQNGIEPDPGAWRPQCCDGRGGSIYLGDYANGNVYLADTANHSDNGTAMRVVVGGAIWFDENVHRCNNVALQMVRGVATSGTDLPVVALRYSDDGARTWSSWILASVGPIGGYRYKASWHSLGLMRQPGRDFEFAVTDTVNVTIEGATVNPARR